MSTETPCSTIMSPKENHSAAKVTFLSIHRLIANRLDYGLSSSSFSVQNLVVLVAGLLRLAHECFAVFVQIHCLATLFP